MKVYCNLDAPVGYVIKERKPFFIGNVSCHFKMTKKHWRLIIILQLLIVILMHLPFYPGPSFMYVPSQAVYFGGQLFSMFGLLLIPLGLVGYITEVRRKEKRLELIVVFLLLWMTPLITFLANGLIIRWGLSDVSRNIAMNNASPIIEGVEKYKLDNGTYPNSLNALKPKYLKKLPSTGVMGIRDFNYLRVDSTFSIKFTQSAILNVNWEVVEYLPTDKHDTKGYGVLQECGKEHWKYYIFD